MKKAFILLLSLSLIFAINEVNAAKIPTKGVVCAKNGLNVRSAPNTNSSRITVLENDTVLEILSVVGKWYKITTGSVKGYVYSTFITVTESKETDDSVFSHKQKVKNGRNMAKSASKATLTATK